MNRRLPAVATAIASAVIGVIAAGLVGPRPLHLDDRVTGDPALVDAARSALGDAGHRQVAIALVDGGDVAFAGFGADERTPFEIGSVTKAMTGMVLADMADDGIVRLDEPVGALVPRSPLASAPATLAELSRHRSGLPRVPATPAFVARSVLSRYTGGDPYTENPDDVLRLAAAAGAPGGADPAYSNLGAAVLGDALAVRAGTTYADLLGQRLLHPLGMRDTTVVTDPDRLPPGHAIPRNASTGREVAPWVAPGWAPAGIGIWSTARDLATWAAAVIEGTAPGASAADPTTPFGDGVRIGLGWFTSVENGRTITWHNGGTGGFHAFVGLDREAARAVVVLSASNESVDGAALRLLTGASS